MKEILLFLFFSVSVNADKIYGILALIPEKLRFMYKGRQDILSQGE